MGILPLPRKSFSNSNSTSKSHSKIKPGTILTQVDSNQARRGDGGHDTLHSHIHIHLLVSRQEAEKHCSSDPGRDRKAERAGAELLTVRRTRPPPPGTTTSPGPRPRRTLQSPALKVENSRRVGLRLVILFGQSGWAAAFLGGGWGLGKLSNVVGAR